MGTTTAQSITLANSIIGVGILAMPFCFQQCGIILATLLLLLAGLLSRLCCHYLLKSAILARRRNFEFLALHVFGPMGKLAVEIGIIGFLMGTCIAYFVVVGDLGPQIISKMFNINQSDVLRTCIMVIVSVVCVLPLGLLRNVDSLSNVSAATICFYFCLVIKVIAEAASQLFTADWYMQVEMWKPAGVLQCLPIFSMALFCQTQLFEIFESMPTLSLEKMNVVTKNAINICSAVYLTLGLFGYIAFSSRNISGNILVSLAPTMANDVIRLGFVMSLAFSFPLIIFPCRASIYSLLYKKGYASHHDHIINHSIPQSTFRTITIAIIVVALCISLLLPNVELVLGLVGSTIGVMICVLFPAMTFLHVTSKNTNERVLAKVVLVVGLLTLVLGTMANLQAAENRSVKYDDKIITQERIDKLVEDFIQKQQHDKDARIKPIVNQVVELKAVDIPAEIEDSKIQPPNPVPPDLQSIETANKNEEQPQIETKDDISDVKEKIAEVDVAPKIEKRFKENVELANPKIDIIKDINLVKDKKPEKQDEIMNIKQKELIETMQQQREEQKELIKEQQEIISEMLEKKNEIPKEKSVEDPKKVALESIQQIRDIAIKKLNEADITAKDAAAKDGESQAVKVESAIVKEIAKNAVESIVAINEIHENIASVADKNPLPNKVHNNEEKHAQNVPQLAAQNVPNKENIPDNEIKDPSQHSHSIDEPNSYKRGEDWQTVKKTQQNPMPIALAMSEHTNIQKPEIKQLSKPEIIDKVNKIDDSNVNKDENTLLREKRETDGLKLSLDPANISKDKLIKYPEEALLEKVDLNDVLSRNNIMDTAVIGRSLKNVDE